MKKRISFFLTALICCIFFSCSNISDNSYSSSVSFSFSNASLARDAAGEEQSNLKLTIKISGDYSASKTFQIQNTNVAQTFVFEDLPAGASVDIEISIFEGLVRKYFASESMRLSDGENVFDAILRRFVSTPCVWLEESEDKTYSLNQLSSYNSSASPSNLASVSSKDIPYTFDNSGNLLTIDSTIDSNTLSKYELDAETGLYSTTSTNQTILQVTGTIKDICYDAATGYTYILAADGTNGLLYAIDSKSNFFSYNSGFSLPSDSSVTPEQIAAYNGTIYVSGSDCAIYKASVSIGNNNTNVVTGDFSKLAELGSSSILSGYDSSKHNDYDYDSLSVTDLQVGDGVGNNAETVYALVREYTSYIDFDISSDFFSRGALIAIDTSSGTTKTYGWTESYVKFNSEKYSLYSPSSSNSSSGLFGPTHFVAIVPKKIVILDDGIVYSNNSDAPFNNNDSLVEFDIAGGTLKRGASVTATKPDASSFTIN